MGLGALLGRHRRDLVNRQGWLVSGQPPGHAQPRSDDRHAGRHGGETAGHPRNSDARKSSAVKPDCLERGAQVVCRLVSAAGVLLQKALNRVSKRRRDAAVAGSHRDRGVTHDRGQDRHGRGPRERPRTGGRFVEEHTERERIRAAVDRTSLRLLRRHVGRRAHQPPGDRLHRGGGLGVGAVRREPKLGEAEVEHLHVPVGAKHDVGRLQVPMHDAARVCGGERTGQFERDLEEARGRTAARRYRVRQRPSLDEFHRQRGDGFSVRGACVDDAVDVGDVRVVERGQRSRFTLEAGVALVERARVWAPVSADARPAPDAGRQDLQGDVPPEPQFPGAIHLPHRAGAKHRNNLVAAEPRAWRE